MSSYRRVRKGVCPPRVRTGPHRPYERVRLLYGKVYLSGQLRRGAWWGVFGGQKGKDDRRCSDGGCVPPEAFVIYGSNFPEGIRIKSSWGSVSQSAPVSVMTTISSTEIVLVVESDSGHE